MQIEVGKRYRTREGGTAEVLEKERVGRWPFRGTEIDGNGESIETGGCAPPVAVNGPVADVYDAMGERPKPPVEHVEPEYSKDAFNIGNPDAGPQPSTLTIPLGNMTEIDLMGALETVMQSFMHQHDGLPTIAKVRATDWFHAKYGSRP